VRDLGSRNGTYVHGRVVTSTRLHVGDTVTFGLHAVQLVWG
jgi:pSer/pThr/pTyr-binding forkhead associated (FHA) protein